VIWVVREMPEDGTGQDTEKSKGVRGTLTGMFEDEPGLTESVMIHPNFSHLHRTPSSSPYPSLSDHYH